MASRSPVDRWLQIPFNKAFDKLSVRKKIKRRDYAAAGPIPVIDQGETLVGGFTEDRTAIVECDLPLIIFGDHTRQIKYVDFPFAPGADGVVILRPKLGYEPKLAYYFLHVLRRLIPDNGYARHFQHLRKLNIPLPPALEQQAIVAKLDELMSQLDKGVEQLQTVKQQLKLYRQAVLKAAFEGKLTAEWREEQQAVGKLPDAEGLLEQIKIEREERYQQQLHEWEQAVRDWEAAGGKASGFIKPRRPAKPKDFQPVREVEQKDLPVVPESWVWSPLGSFTEIVGGVTKGRRLEGRTVVVLPYLRVANVQDGYLDLSEVKRIAIPIEEKDKYLLREGDVLYTEGGDRDKLGRGTVWRGEIPDCIHQNHVFRARPVPSVDPKYLAYFSQTTTARNYFMKHGKQTVNLASINMTLLSQLPVPMPSLEEQRRIVEELDSRMSVLDKLDGAINQAIRQAEGLRKSILEKAFKGLLLSKVELAEVREDPEYEEAEKLLERIRSKALSYSL